MLMTDPTQHRTRPWRAEVSITLHSPAHIPLLAASMFVLPGPRAPLFGPPLSVACSTDNEQTLVFHVPPPCPPQDLVPVVDWIPFLRTVFHPVEINETEPVVVYAKEYLQDVTILINRTDKR